MSGRARLVWRRSEGEPVEFVLDAEVVEIGRGDEAAIRIDEPLVSRRHARLSRRGATWVIADLDSTNFTRVNGNRIRREVELEDGDEVQFARARCVFRQEPGNSETATTDGEDAAEEKSRTA